MANDLETFRKLLGEFSTAMLITHGDDGLHGRPMAVVDSRDDGTLVFITSRQSGKVEEIRDDSDCAVTMQSSSVYLSISGRCRVRADRDLIKSLWSPALDAWFKEGENDPQAIALEFSPSVAEYWSHKGLERLQFLFEALKSLPRGKKIDPSEAGSHGRVDVS